MDQPAIVMRRRAYAAAIVGTSIAFCDFFLYSTAIQIVISPSLVPGGAASSLWLTLATFSGFLGRPLGAVLFSHLGDRVGRKSTLLATLLAIGVPTVAMGFVPLGPGVWTGAALTLLRLLQGIGLGGEWGGSVLLAMEWEPRSDRRALAASLPQVGVPLGLILGTGSLYVVRLLLGQQQLVAWAWHLPFWLSALLMSFALYLRAGVHETPVFRELLEERRTERRPVRHVLTHYRWRIVLAAALRVSADVTFYLLIGFAAVYVTSGQGRRADELTTLVQEAVLAGSFAAIFVIPAAGLLADWVGRKPVYGAGIAATALFAWPLFLLLDTRSPGVVVAAMVVMFVIHGVQFGPQAAMIAELFPPRLRYSGASLGYQLAPLAAGAWAMTIGTHLLSWSHASLPIALYLVGCCAVSAAALRFLPRWAFRYEVALSYASEDREYVGRVAAALRQAGVSVFYDRHELAASWGRDLEAHLNDIYGGQSRFIVLFVSAHYAAKVWPRQELRVAQAEAVRRQVDGCLLPARFDDTGVPGLSPTIGYVDCRRTTPDELATLIVQKVRSP